MKIAIGSDHAGYVLKQKLGAILEKMGHCVRMWVVFLRRLRLITRIGVLKSRRRLHREKRKEACLFAEAG